MQEWEILVQISQGGCKFLGQGGDVKWVEFHCYSSSLRNVTLTPPFI